MKVFVCGSAASWMINKIVNGKAVGLGESPSPADEIDVY